MLDPHGETRNRMAPRAIVEEDDVLPGLIGARKNVADFEADAEARS